MCAAAVHALCRHLRDLLHDEKRCMSLIKESEGIYFDFTRQRVTQKTMEVCRQCALHVPNSMATLPCTALQEAASWLTVASYLPVRIQCAT